MTDRRTVQIVVVFLGIIALGGLASITYLVDHGSPTEAVAIISTITGGALGALGGLLTNSSSVDPVKMEERIRNQALADVASLALEQPAPVVVADTAEVAVQVAAAGGDLDLGQTNDYAALHLQLGINEPPDADDDLGINAVPDDADDVPDDADNDDLYEPALRDDGDDDQPDDTVGG